MGMHAYETDSTVALVVDAEGELTHWRSRFRDLPHCRHMRWEDVKPAIQLGIDACLKAKGRDITEMLDELEVRYRRVARNSRLEWFHAREVVAAEWVRIWDRSKASARDVDQFSLLDGTNQRNPWRTSL